MSNFDIYNDIAKRTNGDVYFGVVGPVRSGKSTFITNFMKLVVLPNIENKHDKQRAIDELPQSANGKTVMTTQPKFIPNEAVAVRIGDALKFKVRLIDCVGYMVDGAMGLEEDEKPRMVQTPWSEKEIPFERAAEIGTDKVIAEHSSILIAITTDGSITNLARENYVKAEQKIVTQLKKSKKPFVLIVNSTEPKSDKVKLLTESLASKYDSPVIAMDVANMTEEGVEGILDSVIKEFPLVSIKVKMPTWLQALSFDNPIIQEIIVEVKRVTDNINKIGEYASDNVLFMESEKFEPIVVSDISLGDGKIVFEIKPKNQLFYIVLSNECGVDIKDDFALVNCLKDLTVAKKEYDKIKDALETVEIQGYGVVYPNLDEMKLEEPQIVKQGSHSGIRLRASASSLHIMKVDIETELSPIVGTEQQSEDLMKYLLSEFESNPQGLWETNMFGKSLHSLVKENLSHKLTQMPTDVQNKMRKTLSRVINEGKGGIICILL